MIDLDAVKAALTDEQAIERFRHFASVGRQGWADPLLQGALERVLDILTRETELREALLDILDLSKGEPRMGGASTFPANAHRMGRIHNRARQAFGEGPLRISGVLKEDE